MFGGSCSASKPRDAEHEYVTKRVIRGRAVEADSTGVQALLDASLGPARSLESAAQQTP